MKLDLAYVVQAESAAGIIKVGRSGAPIRRVSQIRQSVPFGVRVICFLSSGNQTERELKETLATTRVRGEWFDPSPRLVEALERYRDAGRIVQQTEVTAEYVEADIIPRLQAYIASKPTGRLNHNPNADLVFRMLHGEPLTFVGREPHLLAAAPNTFEPAELLGWVRANAFAEVSLISNVHLIHPTEAPPTHANGKTDEVAA